MGKRMAIVRGQRDDVKQMFFLERVKGEVCWSF